MSDVAASFAHVRAAAGLLVLDDHGRVLLVVPSYKTFLDIPGGYVEPGETPAAAARREVREELGIERTVGQLLVTDWWQDSPDGVGEPKVLFIFDGGSISETERDLIFVDGNEVTGYRFHDITDLGHVTIPRLANRIEHAVDARRKGRPRYLENGKPITPSA